MLGFWDPQLHLIYRLAIETQFLSFENKWNVFSILVTHIQFWSLTSVIQNSSKQEFIHGTHKFWIMS